jgi:DNA-binding response OmpR family regulator
MTGIELAAKARQDRPELPIILASGYAEIPSGEGLGLFRLAKPYRREELLAGVTSVMAAHRQGSADTSSARIGRLKVAGGSDEVSRAAI